jgi:tetratricopeptide (TPR) repeat protein
LRTFRTILGDELNQSTIVQAAPQDQIRYGLELALKPDTTRLTEAVARELAIRASIRTVVTAQVDQVGPRYLVLARVLDAESGAVITSERGQAEGDEDLLLTLERIARGLREGLGEDPGVVRATRPLMEIRTPSLQAYVKYAEAERQRLVEFDPAESKRLLLEVVEDDPGFAMAWLALWNLGSQGDSMHFQLEQARRYEDRMTEAERGYLDFIESADLDGQTAALERAVRAQPNDLRWYRILANLVARDLRTSENVETALDLLDRAEEISPFGLYQRDRVLRTELLIRLGRTEMARDYLSHVEREETRRALLQIAAIRDADWAAAESLAVAPEFVPNLPGALRVGTHAKWASSHIVRGEIGVVLEWIAGFREATSGSEAPWVRTPSNPCPSCFRGAPPVEQLLAVVTETIPVPNDSTCWQFPPQGDECYGGAHIEVTQEALAGDAIATRHALDAFIADTFTQRREIAGRVTRERYTRWSNRDPAGVRVPFIQTMIAYHARHWESVVQHGDPIVGLIPWGPATP